MATYKVIQDIEAEDKLVGPLTLRQFIYAGVAAVCLYICFLAYSKGASFLIGIFLPVAAVGVFFAFPWKGEQPTEIWALARLRFSVKPRRRIWDQDGVKDLVTITVPKKIEVRRSSKADLTQTEVRSRLKALADTIDSRGWATRNAAYNSSWNHPTLVAVPNNPALAASLPNDDMFDDTSSVSQNFDAMLAKSSEEHRQRLVRQVSQIQHPQDPAPQPAAAAAWPAAQLPAPVLPTLPQPVAAAYAYAEPQAAVQPAAMPAMPQPAAGYWFANGPAYPTAAGIPTVAPAAPAVPDFYAGQPVIESDAPLATAAIPSADEAAMGSELKQQQRAAMAVNYNHLRVLQPVGADGSLPPQPAAAVPVDATYAQPFQPAVQSAYAYANDPAATPPPVSQPAAPPVTPEPNPAILKLANNDDLDIATIARQASREINKSPDEVEIRLH